MESILGAGQDPPRVAEPRLLIDIFALHTIVNIYFYVYAYVDDSTIMKIIEIQYSTIKFE